MRARKGDAAMAASPAAHAKACAAPKPPLCSPLTYLPAAYGGMGGEMGGVWVRAGALFGLSPPQNLPRPQTLAPPRPPPPPPFFCRLEGRLTSERVVPTSHPEVVGAIKLFWVQWAFVGGKKDAQMGATAGGASGGGAAPAAARPAPAQSAHGSSRKEKEGHAREAGMHGAGGTHAGPGVGSSASRRARRHQGAARGCS